MGLAEKWRNWMERVDVDDLPDEKPAPKKEKKKKKKRKKGVTVGKKFSNSLRDRRRRQAEALDYK